MALPIFIGEKMAKHILSCSFGKDSIATALLALQHGEPLDELVYCEVMFSEEISGELPEHNRFIHETAIPYFEQRGIPTRVLRSEKTYLSCFYHVVTRGKTKGMLSGFPLSGRCTIQRDCKLPPIKAYQKALPPDTVQYIGIAADEPKRLARLKPGQISLLDKYHVAEPEARSMCAAEELLSPLYDFTKRGGCWFCPNASISELRHLYRYHPELWQLYYDVYILTKLQAENIDFPALGAALMATASKRGSDSILQDYRAIVETVRNSEIMRRQWDNYRKDFDYASTISFDEVCDAVASTMDTLITNNFFN